MNSAQRYFPTKLLNKLKLIAFKALTIVEAPSGYGKTSAVHEAMAAVSPTLVHWATMIDESFALSYRRLCSTIESIDYLSGQALINLGYPNRSNEKAIAALIRDMKSDHESWLVLDDLQFLQRDLAPSILRAFTEIRSENLKVVLISLDLSSQLPGLKNKSEINFIQYEDLKLSSGEIREFFAHAGITLTRTMAQALYTKTAGCLVVLAMHLQIMRESGQTLPQAEIFDLINAVMWSRLGERERRLLMPFAVFKSLSLPQLAKVTEYEEDELLTQAILLENGLIRFDSSDRNFYPHPLLSTFLKKQLDDCANGHCKTLYKIYGDLLQDMSRPLEALSCYYKGKNYEAMLASPLELLEYETIADLAFDEVAAELLTECPQEIKERHPLSLLKLAYYLFNALRFAEFDRALEETRALIWSQDDPQLQGEWYLLAALRDLPDLDEMYEKYTLAARLLTRPSDLFTKKSPYLFGHASYYLLLYNDLGKGDAIAEQFTRLLKLYTQMTNGHGRGADLVLKGELAALRCHFQEAEILAFEAAVLAKEQEQVSVAYAVALLLGRTAISKADMQGLEKAITYLEYTGSGYEFMYGTRTNQILLDSVRNMLLSLLGRSSEIPSWTKLVKDKSQRTGMATFPFNLISGVDLLLHGEFTQAIGLLEALEKAEPFLATAGLRYYCNIGTSLAYAGLGEIDTALDKLEQALSLSEADELLGSFVQYHRYLKPLLRLEKLRKKHGPFIEKIIQVAEGAVNEKRPISAVVAAQALPATLSARVVEIAELAAQGMHNHEIATTLRISEWTVKNHVKNIYKKLSIDRRSQLIALLN